VDNLLLPRLDHIEIRSDLIEMGEEEERQTHPKGWRGGERAKELHGAVVPFVPLGLRK